MENRLYPYSRPYGTRKRLITAAAVPGNTASLPPLKVILFPGALRERTQDCSPHTRSGICPFNSIPFILTASAKDRNNCPPILIQSIFRKAQSAVITNGIEPEKLMVRHEKAMEDPDTFISASRNGTWKMGYCLSLKGCCQEFPHLCLTSMSLIFLCLLPAILTALLCE